MGYKERIPAEPAAISTMQIANNQGIMVRQVECLSMGGTHLKKPAFFKAAKCSFFCFFVMNNYSNISFDDCTPSHDPSNRNTRILLLPKMMMFSECKIYNIAEKDVSTLQNDFQIASGNQSGIIGFDYREGLMSADVAVPTTLLNRPLTDYCTEPKRILFVFEMTSSEKYIPIYEIKTGLYSRLIEEGKLTNTFLRLRRR